MSQVRRACSDHDAQAVRERMLEWGRLRFPDQPPATLTALGRRLDAPVAAALTGVEAALYGRSATAWRGDELLAALKRIDAVAPTERARGADDGLVPLYR